MTLKQQRIDYWKPCSLQHYYFIHREWKEIKQNKEIEQHKELIHYLSENPQRLWEYNNMVWLISFCFEMYNENKIKTKIKKLVKSNTIVEVKWGYKVVEHSIIGK